MNSMLGSTAELAILLKLKDEVTGPLNNIDRSLQGLNTRSATVSGGLTKIGGGLALGAERLAIGLIAVGGSVAAVAVSATNAAAKYQAAMELVHTQAGATQAEVDSMSQSLLTLAPKVGTNATDLAAGLYHIESAGVRGAKALQELTIAAEGAKVGQANLEDVTNALVGAVNTGISGTENMSSAMGTLNAIVGAGNMRMGDLAGAITTGILPVAKSLGLSLTDVGAALADMTDQGVPATDAATRLRMTFSLMEAPTSKAQKAFKEIGLSSVTLADDMRQPNGLLVALRDLKSHLDASGMSAVQQSQIISEAFGGGRTSSTILTLLGSLDRLQTKYADITAGTNSFAQAWDSTALTIDERKAMLGAGVDALKIKLGDELLPVEGKVLDALTKLASDPAVTAGIASLGDGLASLFTDQNIANAESFISGVVPGLMSFAKDVLPPLEEGLKVTGQAAKAAFDMFMALPEPVKAAVIAAIAANKLTGGLVASGLGDLAKVGLGAATGSGGGGVAGALGMVQKVYVVNMPPGGIGGLGGGAAGEGATAVEGAAGAGALGAGIPLAVLGSAIALGVISLYAEGSKNIRTNTDLGAQGLTPAEIQAYKYSQMDATEQHQAAMHGYGKGANYDQDLASALAKLGDATAKLNSTITYGPAVGMGEHGQAGALATAAQSLDGAVHAWRDTSASLNAALSHDTTGADLHASAQSLDSAVRAWRSNPPPAPHINVYVDTSVSVYDVNRAQVHTGSYRTAIPV